MLGRIAGRQHTNAYTSLAHFMRYRSTVKRSIRTYISANMAVTSIGTILTNPDSVIYFKAFRKRKALKEEMVGVSTMHSAM